MNCTLQNAVQPIALYPMLQIDAFEMKYSEIKNAGKYYGPFPSDDDFIGIIPLKYRKRIMLQYQTIQSPALLQLV